MVLSQTKQCLFSGRGGGVLLVRIKGLRGVRIRRENKREKDSPTVRPAGNKLVVGAKEGDALDGLAVNMPGVTLAAGVWRR